MTQSTLRCRAENGRFQISMGQQRINLELRIQFELRIQYNLDSSTIMFFGKVITKSSPVQLNEEQVDETSGEVISLTNVALAPGSKTSSDTQLYIKKNNQEFLVAVLNRERPTAIINLFVALLDDVTLVVKGDGALHVTGFSEPEPEGGLPFDEEEESQEVPEEAPAEKINKAQVSLKTTKKSNKPEPPAVINPESKQKKPHVVTPKPQSAAPAESDDCDEDLQDDIEDDDEDINDAEIDDDIDDDDDIDEDDDDDDDDNEGDEEDEEDEAQVQPHKEKPAQFTQKQSQNRGNQYFQKKNNKHQNTKPHGQQGEKFQGQQGGKFQGQQGGKFQGQQGGKFQGQQGGKFQGQQGGKFQRQQGGQQGGKFHGQQGGKPNFHNKGQHKGGKKFNKSFNGQNKH